MKERRNSTFWGYLGALGLLTAFSLPGCFESEDNAPPLAAATPTENTTTQTETPVELPATEEGGEEELTVEDVKLSLLSSFSSRVVAATYAEFVTAVDELASATNQWSTSMSEEDRTAAQLAWTNAIAVWQRAEVFQVGPAAASGESNDSGQDLRDLIYSWPLVNGCRIDQETLEGAYADQAAFKDENVNVQGLDTLERLLFNTSPDNDCSVKSSINKNGDWDALTADEVNQKRAEYAAALSEILQDRATELETAWDTFSAHLVAPGGENPHFPTTQDALNAVSDSLFYFDKITKDAKLGIPLGLSNCEEELCPNAVESQYAAASTLHLRENLVGMKMVLFGGSEAVEAGQYGWVDLLASLGGSDLANDMLDGLDAALLALDALEGTTLKDGLSTHFEEVSTVYNRIQDVTTIMKGPFLSTLNLQIPASAATDND